MGTRKIFLSYRRDDSPGYVSRLEDELERVFGEDRVFRDVEDIKGGTKWKVVLERNLANAAVVLLIIGPRWQAIWEARRHDSGTNYVALELMRAQSLDVPVIPVTVDGGRLGRDLDLGDIAWIRDNQTYDLSDTQGRWSADLAGLIHLLESIEGVGPAGSEAAARTGPGKSSALLRRAGIAAAVVLALAILIPQFMRDKPSEGTASPGPGPTGAGAVQESPETQPPGAQEAAPVQARELQPAPSVAAQPRSAAPALPVPNIAGTWQGKDGSLYVIAQFTDGSLRIERPGNTSGTGRFMERMPNKFEMTLDGVGRGEFSVSTDGQRIMGYLVVNGAQQFDTLTRAE